MLICCVQLEELSLKPAGCKPGCRAFVDKKAHQHTSTGAISYTTSRPPANVRVFRPSLPRGYLFIHIRIAILTDPFFCTSQSIDNLQKIPGASMTSADPSKVVG